MSRDVRPLGELARAEGPELLHRVEQFLYREARYADDLEYDAWEALWTDDAVYWIPANGDDIDPTTQMSIIFDNRARISTRIKQLHTGKRHSQIPASRLRRIVGNVELLTADPEHPDDIRVAANVVIYESRERGLTIWAAGLEYRLRETDDGLRMAYKKVKLADNARPVNTLSFLV